jgi:hypothetical protein
LLSALFRWFFSGASKLRAQRYEVWLALAI